MDATCIRWFQVHQIIKGRLFDKVNLDSDLLLNHAHVLSANKGVCKGQWVVHVPIFDVYFVREGRDANVVTFVEVGMEPYF